MTLFGVSSSMRVWKSPMVGMYSCFGRFINFLRKGLQFFFFFPKLFLETLMPHLLFQSPSNPNTTLFLFIVTDKALLSSSCHLHQNWQKFHHVLMLATFVSSLLSHTCVCVVVASSLSPNLAFVLITSSLFLPCSHFSLITKIH